MIHASEVAIDDSVVQDVAASTANRAGRGVNVQVGADSKAPAKLTITRSLDEGCLDGGVVASAAEIVAEATVVRDVSPNLDEGLRGYGLVVQSVVASPTRAALTLTDSLVEATHEAAIFAIGSDAVVVGTRVRKTRHVEPLDLELPAKIGGRGISVQRDDVHGYPASLTVVGSQILDSEEAGIFAEGATLDVEGSAVLGVVGLDGNLGRGIIVESSADLVPGEVTLASSVVEEATEVGIFIEGSNALIDGVVVRDTQPRADGDLGVGVDLEQSHANGVPATGEIRISAIERSRLASLTNFGAEVTIHHSLLRDARPSDAHGDFGDTIAAIHFSAKPVTLVRDSLLAEASRAGISNFGGDLLMGGSVIDCAAIDLAGEPYKLTDPFFQDLDQNACGCGQDQRTCKVLSSGLSPPQPPPEL